MSDRFYISELRYGDTLGKNLLLIRIIMAYNNDEDFLPALKLGFKYIGTEVIAEALEKTIKLFEHLKKEKSNLTDTNKIKEAIAGYLKKECDETIVDKIFDKELMDTEIEAFTDDEFLKWVPELLHKMLNSGAKLFYVEYS